MTADPILTVAGVSKRFGTHQALQNVSLSLTRGRVTAILGPNGSGKTTLIKSILGLTSMDAGTITFDGHPLLVLPASRGAIGYMPQSARFPDNLAGAELISMLSDLRGATGVTDRELIDRFRLGSDLVKPFRTLSGGTKQKVNAVLAFLFMPQLLILDEATAGLDPVASGVLKDKIREGRRHGRTFVLTSHVMTELEELTDDVVFLLDGTVRFTGSLHDLKLATRQLNLERAVAHLMRHSAGEAA